jgi:hypothetical protein
MQIYFLIMEIDESIFLQLLKKFEDEIIANNNNGQFGKFARLEKNSEEIKNYINQIIEEIARLKV